MIEALKFQQGRKPRVTGVINKKKRNAGVLLNKLLAIKLRIEQALPVVLPSRNSGELCNSLRFS